MYCHHKFGLNYKYSILAVYILLSNVNAVIFKAKPEEKLAGFSEAIPQSRTVEEFYKVEQQFEHFKRVRWIKVERRLTRADKKNLSADVERYFTPESKAKYSAAQLPTSSANLSSIISGINFFCLMFILAAMFCV
ncbi:hypothetical protein DdX_13793 [Ditylenchus destructor]|uniref:Uncharacterized protein n=1 Tax=Ditylenchus destructor TaxID=166010 RepID=A0AAD4MY12_9BILA|nr:hypothetical protein DdX_13793 [Ditylenchus destructor]